LRSQRGVVYCDGFLPALLGCMERATEGEYADIHQPAALGERNWSTAPAGVWLGGLKVFGINPEAGVSAVWDALKRTRVDDWVGDDGPALVIRSVICGGTI